MRSGAHLREEPTEPPSADAAPSEERADRTPDRERRLTWWALIAVGAAFLVAQLALVPPGRPSGWDEAVYVSQVSPSLEALFMAAWRARGITLLIAPATVLGGSLTAVHAYLAILSAATVVLAFRIWIPLIGIAAAVAAFLFSFTWLSVVNGSAVMPNFWAAILGVTAAGLVARRLEGGGLATAVLACVVLGAMTLVRPTDATVVAGAIGLTILLVRRSSWRLLFGLGAGLAAGWLPWVVEMSIRFGGLGGALRAASAEGHLSVSPVSENLLAHLGFTYGRAKLAPDGLPEEGLLWWGCLVVLGVVALRPRVGTPGRWLALLGWLVTLGIGIEYVILVPYHAGRFLLPAYAFASIAASVGVVSLLRNGLVTRVLGGVAVALLLPWAVWQGTVAARVVDRESRAGERFEAAGALLRDLADGRPCSFVSPGAYPQIHLVSGCVGDQTPIPPLPTPAQWDAVAAGEEVFLILPRRAPPDSPLAILSPTSFEAPKRTWFIYRLSEASG